MVPDSVDERILQEHFLRDRFYNFDYTSLSSASVSASNSLLQTSSTLHTKLGYTYDLVFLILVFALPVLLLFAVLKAIITLKRNHQRASSPLLPTSFSPSILSVTSFSSSASSSPTLSSSATFSPKERLPGSKAVGLFDKLFGLTQDEDRFRQD
ncbi:hypothetical protein V1512DRAFT_247121 [Lipomyces arxii]|uniref:uncharacterized protein n=1 Tax=Lipomyces arxii TaxID=56418 RepID=UPI0034CF8C2B